MQLSVFSSLIFPLNFKDRILNLTKKKIIQVVNIITKKRKQPPGENCNKEW